MAKCSVELQVDPAGDKNGSASPLNVQLLINQVLELRPG